MANIKELREKIAARKAEKLATQTAKFAKMRSVAEKAPEKLEACIARIADKCAGMAEGWENLRENLNLKRAAKDAPLKVRVGSVRNYAKTFKRIAEEQPEKLVEALQEAYEGLNDVAAEIEIAAEQMGVDLESPISAPEQGEDFGSEFEDEVEEEGVAQDIIEEAKEENEPPAFELEEKAEGIDVEKLEEESVEDKEASGSDAWVTDRDDKGEPKAPVTAGQRDSSLTGESTKFAAMSKKDYIAIADDLRNMNVDDATKRMMAEGLCPALQKANPRFKKDRFIGYVMGENGPGGGHIKKKPVPSGKEEQFKIPNFQS